MSKSEPRMETLDDEIERALLRARKIFFSGPVMEDTVREAIRKVWFLDINAPKEPITLVISSPGGSVDAGFALWDQLKMTQAPITTLVTGLAASMGSILSLAGDKGRRFCTPNARIMIHQPSMGGITGPAADLEISAREIIKTRSRIAELYAEVTGKDKETMEKAIDRDNWLSPEEAMDFGLIDKVVSSADDL